MVVKGKKAGVVFLLLWTLMSAQAQQFIGCRILDGWAETPMLRQRFHVDAGELRQSSLQHTTYTLTVASLGYHDVYVNDSKVGNCVMQPAVSQLDKRALRVTYDITPYVHEGDNELMLWLGQGWGRIYGTPAVAQATLEECVSDGECGLIYTIFVTDSTWEASPSPYSYTGNWQPLQFGGEQYDARVKPHWRPAAAFDTKGIIVSQQEFKGNHYVDVLKPQSVETLADGGVMIDFGRVVTGHFKAAFGSMAAGQEVTMEHLDHRDAKPPHTETDIFISDGSGDNLFANRFHSHSFRYVRVRGADVVSAAALQISAVDPTDGATFECSDARLNAIHDMVKYTLSCLTFSGYMVDCPHIERMGYGGDGNSSTMALQTIWDVRSTYANWLQAWADAMQPDGELPYVAPAFRTGGGPYWSGFIVKAPWRTYINYGNEEYYCQGVNDISSTLIYRHYDVMKHWLEYIERHSEDYILQPWPDNERHSWFLGDWAVPEGVDKGGESVLHASSCFVSDCLADMIQMARMTGHSDDARHYAAWRNNLNAAIHRHFYHPETHTYANGTPLDQCYALLMGIPPDSATAAAVKTQLLKDCHGKYRDHIAAGLMGVPVFTEWCVRERQTDLMATILRQPDYPGYLHMMDKECVNVLMSQCVSGEVKNTNTLTQSHNSALNNVFTTWESWDCGRPGKEDRSRVHNCYNGIGIWFYQALAGILPDVQNPGYKHFFVDPQPCEGVDWVRCTKPTPYGDISVEITYGTDTAKKASTGTIKITVPQGTSATLFPGAPNERTLAPGKWEIEMTP